MGERQQRIRDPRSVPLTGVVVPSGEGNQQDSVAARTSGESKLANVDDSLPPKRKVILITLAMFSGYAATVTMQHELQLHLKIPNDPNSPEKKAFTIAVTCQYLGNLIFRLGHNVFYCLSASQRVSLSQLAMMVAMSLILLLFYYPISSFVLLSPLSIVIIAYLLSGLAIGTFESNCMASLAILGPNTKLWAVIGLPLGFNIISVGGMALLSFGMPRYGVYLFVLVMNFFGFLLYKCGLPKGVHIDRSVVLVPNTITSSTGDHDHATNFVESAVPTSSYAVRTTGAREDQSAMGNRQQDHGAHITTEVAAARTTTSSPVDLEAVPGAGVVRFNDAVISRRSGAGCCGKAVRQGIRSLCNYLPKVLPHSLALLVAMFGVASCTGITTNIFSGKKVPLFADTPDSAFLIDQHLFLSILNAFVFLGDSVSRKIAYLIPAFPKTTSAEVETGAEENPVASMSTSRRINRKIFLRQIILLLFFNVFCTLSGLYFLSLKMGFFAIIGAFLIFYGNGSVYATTTRFVDKQLAMEFHVRALSVWLFVGDLGSVSGSSLTDVFHRHLCGCGSVKHYWICK
ncbi:unnamed protein product [Amoebophrya sp. A120]|nr:unnamed protein product [Amoebophrya sp. A120]|eukprot:GSA120T00010125001.1